MTAIDGNVLEGVSATTIWTLRNRATEAKRSDGVIRDPWAVTLLDAIDSVPPWFSQRTLEEHKLSNRYITPPMPFALTADEGVALADRIPTVRGARDIALPPGRGIFKLAFWPPLDRIGLLRHGRPSITLLEFG